MACRLIGAKPLSKPMMIFYQWHSKEETSMGNTSKLTIFFYEIASKLSSVMLLPFGLGGEEAARIELPSAPWRRQHAAHDMHTVLISFILCIILGLYCLCVCEMNHHFEGWDGVGLGVGGGGGGGGSGEGSGLWLLDVKPLYIPVLEMYWSDHVEEYSLQWRHNGCYGVSKHQPQQCLLNRLFGCRSRKHQSFASLDVVRGIHRGPVNSPHKWPVTRKMFPFDDVIM